MAGSSLHRMLLTFQFSPGHRVPGQAHAEYVHARARELATQMRAGTFEPVPRDPAVEAHVAAYMRAERSEEPEGPDAPTEPTPGDSQPSLPGLEPVASRRKGPVRAVAHRTTECECGLRVTLADYHGAHRFSDAHEEAMAKNRGVLP